MPITQTHAPGELMQAFLAGFGVNSAERQAPLQFSLPLYSLSVPVMQANPQEPLLKLVGWQFLTTDAQGRLVAGEVPNRSDVGPPPTTSLVRGFSIDDAWKAYDTVIAHPDVLRGSFVLRRLRISALGIDAFWLKAVPAGANAVVDPSLPGTSVGSEQNAPHSDTLADDDRVFAFVAFDERLKFRLVSASEFLVVALGMAAKMYTKRSTAM